MKVMSRYLVLGLAAALMVGCSSSGKKELPPADLEKFDAEVQLDRVWKRNIGVGQGDLYNNLTPALDGLTLYAADAEGRVVALNREDGDEKWEVKLKAPGVLSALHFLGVLLVKKTCHHTSDVVQQSGEYFVLDLRESNS